MEKWRKSIAIPKRQMHWLRMSQNTWNCSVDLEPDPLCTASLLNSTLKDGRKGDSFSREKLFMLLKWDLSRAEEKRKGGICRAQRAIFCLYHWQAIVRMTLVHVAAHKHACSSHSGETGWKLSSLYRKYYCCSAVKVTVSLGYLLCKY